jgi:hypothetical protein
VKARSFAAILTSLALLLVAGVAPAAADTTPDEGQVDLIAGLALTSARVDQRTGLVTLTGTVVCSAEFGSVRGYVRQSHGGDPIIGYGFAELQCTGEPEAFTIQVVTDPGSTGGRFRKGWSLVELSASGCTNFVGCEDERTGFITLRLAG